MLYCYCKAVPAADMVVHLVCGTEPVHICSSWISGSISLAGKAVPIAELYSQASGLWTVPVVQLVNTYDVPFKNGSEILFA